MKVIDLLNKIANEEEVPKKIRYGMTEWFYCDSSKDYFKDNDNTVSFQMTYVSNPNWLNLEVEIIENEEDKKIEKIETHQDSEGLYFYDKHCKKIYITCDEINFMFEQFNEIIDRLNEMDKGE